jgi:hypothetical protein
MNEAEQLLTRAMRVAVERGMLAKVANEETYLNNWETMKIIVTEVTDTTRTEIERLTAERDALLEACEPLVQYLDAGNYGSNRLTEIMSAARAAIAKVRGGAK